MQEAQSVIQRLQNQISNGDSASQQEIARLQRALQEAQNRYSTIERESMAKQQTIIEQMRGLESQQQQMLNR